MRLTTVSKQSRKVVFTNCELEEKYVFSLTKNMADQADDKSLKVIQVGNFVVYYIKYCIISHL